MKLKYKLWWNDKSAMMAQAKYGIPIIIISTLILYFVVFDKVSFSEFLILIAALSIFIYSFFDFVLKLPNGFIDEKTDTVTSKKYRRFYLFVLGIILSYLMSIPILAKYYSFFNQFLGANFLRSHFGF